MRGVTQDERQTSSNHFFGKACIVIALFCVTSLYGYFEDKESLKNIIVIEEEPENHNNYFLYLTASYQHASNRVDKAVKTYAQLFKQKPSVYAYHNYLYLLADLNLHEAITKIFEKHEKEIEKAFADNIEIQNIFAQSLLTSNKQEKAQVLLDKLLVRFPDSDQVAYAACIMYFKINQLEKAEKLIDRSLASAVLKQKHFLFHFLKSKVLVSRNQLKEALVQVEKSIQLFPRFDKALLFRAMLLENMGNITNAIKGYKKLLNLTGRNEMIEKQIIHLLFSQQRFGEALRYMKKIKGNNPDYFADIALMELNMGNTKMALEQIDRALALDPRHQRSHVLKAEILLQTRQYPMLMSFMQTWMIATRSDTAALEAFLLLRNTPVGKPLLIQTLKETVRQVPALHFVAALVDLLLEEKQHKDALAYLQRIAHKTSPPDVRSKALFYTGYVHFLNNQHDQVEAPLREAIAQSSVYPSAYNLLAYHYANNKKNLGEALGLAEKALSVAPNCYYYLDTKGFVLLQQGKKQEAKKLFEEALAYAPDDRTIQQHLALTHD